jgi:signal peptidase II
VTRGLSRASRLGLAIAAAVVLADLAAKRAVLDGLALEATGPIPLTPFLDLVLVWNRGISYGLLTQDTAAGRWLLVAVTAAATVALLAWLVRTTSRLTAASLGLVVGGAVGNGIDRVAYGAVIDFVHFHVGDFSWYVFNVADAAIVVGAAGLVLEAARGRPIDAAKGGSNGAPGRKAPGGDG